MLEVVDETKVSQVCRMLLKHLVDSFLDLGVVRAANHCELFNQVDTAIREFPWLHGASEAMIHAATATLELRSEGSAREHLLILVLNVVNVVMGRVIVTGMIMTGWLGHSELSFVLQIGELS